MAGMTGEYQHSLDAKGRLFIPAKLREDLGDVFYVTISITKDKVPSAPIPNESMAGHAPTEVNAMPYVKQQQRCARCSPSATRCELDTQGRVLLPQNLRRLCAGLTKNVTVVGSNNHAEFWDSDSWEPVYASEEITPENIAAVVDGTGVLICLYIFRCCCMSALKI
jgi:MraZ protein